MMPATLFRRPGAQRLLVAALLMAVWMLPTGGNARSATVHAAGQGSVSALLHANLPELPGLAEAIPDAPHALHGIINVTTTNQEVDTDGDCSLQEAIYAANFDASLAIDPSNLNGPKISTGCAAGSGADTIVLPANAVLQVSGIVQNQFSIAGLVANPDITSTITIQGNGARLERVGSINLHAFVVNQQVGLEVSNATGNLTIQNMHIRNFIGKGGNGADGGGGGMGAGGAIYVRNGTLTIDNTTFENNVAIGGQGAVPSSGAGGGGGGGIGGNGQISGAGANGAGGGGGGSRGIGGSGFAAGGGGGGGGTANDGVVGSATLGGNGGFNCGGKGGDPEGANGGNGFCTGGGGGGGAASSSAVTLTGGTGGIGNYGGGGGGGGSNTVVTTTHRGGDGGNGGFGGGGGMAGDGFTPAATGGNGGSGGFGGGGGSGGFGAGTPGPGGDFGGSAGGPQGGGGGGAALGGAIFNDAGNVTIRNSTFFSNSVVASTPVGGGTAGQSVGGAIFARNGSTKVYNSTFSTNSAGAGSGGAIYVFAGPGPAPNGSFIVRNSILTNNGTAECFIGSTTTVANAGSGNLIRNNAGGANACPGVVSTADPVLGPLQINSPGNTPTMAITRTSPAFNTADSAACLATDQRGVTRPQGLLCDIGAFELQAIDISVTKSCIFRNDAGRFGEAGFSDVGVAGDQWICAITVTNQTTGTLFADVTVTDTVPVSSTYVANTVGFTNTLSTTGAPAVCTVPPVQGGGTVFCSGIDLAGGESKTFELAFRISSFFVENTATGEAPITNVACVVPGGLVFDPNPNNNCGIDTDLVKELADLKISKFSEPHDTVRAGDIFTYTVFVDNFGPSSARNVVVTDTLLSSSLVSVQSCAFSVSQGGGAITQFTCSTGPLVSTQFGSDGGTFGTNSLDATGPNQQGRLRASFRLVALVPIDVTNIARVTASTPDPDYTNNQAVDEITVTGVANLGVTKSAVGEEQQAPNNAGLMFNGANFGQPFPTIPNYFVSIRVTAGRRISYTLNVANTGPSTAENVVLSDRLPAGVRIYQGSVITSNGSCTGGTPGDPLDKLTCGIGSLGSGQAATVTFQVITDASIPAGTVLVNDASATTSTFDPTTANNYASTLTTVLAAADLTVTKTAVGQNVTSFNTVQNQFITQDLANQVTAGLLLRYQITVQNNGPSDSQYVTIQDSLPTTPLPGPVTLVRTVGADCRPDAVNQQIIFCDLGHMRAGDRKTFDVFVRVDPSVPAFTSLTNTALALSGSSTTSPPGPPPNPPIGGPTQTLTFDPNTTDNTSTNFTTVNAVADRGISVVTDPGTGVTGALAAGVSAPAPASLKEGIADGQVADGGGQIDAATPQADPATVVAGTEHRYRITFRNDGPSTLVNLGITDQLDFKQAGLTGETFLRCEPLDPDDLVSCTYNAATNIVTVTTLRVGNELIINGGLGTLLPGRVISFILVALVDPGYILDASNTLAANANNSEPGAVARNTALISGTTTDFRTQNNQDTERTKIIARADLQVTKADEAAGFMNCDPVSPGGVINYTIVVSNTGPSDAAQVFVVDQLPAAAVVADPSQVTVSVSRGAVVEKRDDGRITIIAGNDANNAGALELGRLNARSAPVVISIFVIVRRDAACGSKPANTVLVETRGNNTNSTAATLAPPWPLIVTGPPEGAALVSPTTTRTPTLDPNPANNTATETTTIECANIKINKTVSFEGICPGFEGPITYQPGKPVTFCFEITNNGTTFLDTLRLTDTLRTRMGESILFTQTINFGVDPRLPIAPGEVVRRSVTLPAIQWDQCGTVDDIVTVIGNVTNSGRTPLPCVPAVNASDTVRIDVTCAGLDYRLQLPVINFGNCKSWIQIQNLGDNPTAAMVVFWGDAGACPPQSAGPLKIECSGLLKPGSSWGFMANQLPAGARSAMAYSLNATNQIVDANGVLRAFNDVACNQLFFDVVGDHGRWVSFDTAYRTNQNFRGLDFGKNRGEPLGALVNQSCPDTADPAVMDWASYIGISTDGEGSYDAAFGGFTYYAPLVFANKGGLNSWIYIQNSGVLCTSLELWFKAQDNCLRPILGDVLTVAPGETVHFDPNTVVGPDWIGSVWVRASQPMGMVVQTMGPNHFTSYSGVPGDVANDPLRFFSIGAQVNYAPLIYSEYQGWDTAIQVQNLSAIVPAKVKVYFLDRSGDIITTLVDWVCPRGSQTFFLPQIATLPGNWAGSARIESQEWWSPGSPVVDPPRIQSVVLLERWSDAQRTVRRQAVAYNAPTECTAFDWQLGKGRGGTASGSAVIGLPLIAKGNRGITSEIAITNLVVKPGFTDFAVYIYDQNGLLDYICQKVSEKEVDYLDLSTYGWVPPNFLGSAVISAVFWEHEVFDGTGVFQRNLVGLAAVLVERVGGVQTGPDVPGDESKASEGIPLFDYFMPMGPFPNCPGIGGVRP